MRRRWRLIQQLAKGKQGGEGPTKKDKTGSFAAQGSSDSKKGCFCCKGQHGTFRCEDFAKLSIDQRRKMVKDGDGCFNCMAPGHQVAKCTSKHSCRSPGCGKRHHSMLHVESTGGKGGKNSDKTANHLACQGNCQPQSKVTPQQPATSVPPAAAPVAHVAPQAPTPVVQNVAGPSAVLPLTAGAGIAGAGRADVSTNSTVPLLGTAMVPFLNSVGATVKGRALLDSGSQLNFVTERFVKKLGLIAEHSDFVVHTIGSQKPQQTLGGVSMEVNLEDGERLAVHAQVLKEVTGTLPSIPIDIKGHTELEQSGLADKKFNLPGEIDLLIGVELYEQLILQEKKRVGQLTLTKSKVGWVVTGTGKIDIKAISRKSKPKDPFTGYAALDNDIRKFWEINDIKDTFLLAKAKEHYTEEEKFVDQHFEGHYNH